MEPECFYGMLQTDTEIHVGPPVKQFVNTILTPEKNSFQSIISNLLDQFVRKPLAESSNHHRVRLRVHPINESENFKDFMEKHGVFCHPYMALVLKENSICCKETENWVGRIKNGDTTSYFNVVFIENEGEWVFLQNTIYLTNSLIQQLNVDIKQRVDVDLLIYPTPKQPQCESIKFYTFCKVIRFHVFLLYI